MASTSSLLGLHHVSALTGQASANLRFYTEVLGLRLALKTVNQDDPSSSPLFYSNESGDTWIEIATDTRAPFPVEEAAVVRLSLPPSLNPKRASMEERQSPIGFPASNGETS